MVNDAEVEEPTSELGGSGATGRETVRLMASEGRKWTACEGQPTPFFLRLQLMFPLLGAMGWPEL